MNKKVILCVEVLLFILALISVLLWIICREGKYEPWAVLFALFFVVSDAARRHIGEKEKGREKIKEDNYREEQKEGLGEVNSQLKRLSEVFVQERNGLAPLGTKVVVVNSSKLPQQDKLTAPGWMARMDQYSEKVGYITGYADFDYKLDIDGGENTWAGRWLTQCS